MNKIAAGSFNYQMLKIKNDFYTDCSFERRCFLEEQPVCGASFCVDVRCLYSC